MAMSVADKEFWDKRALTFPLDFERESIGILREMLKGYGGKTVVDLGCGPGTHSIALSSIFREVASVDYSTSMLDRLEVECEMRSIKNIGIFREDCMGFDPKCRYDVAFSCLCPVLYSLDGARKMESLSKDLCIFIGPSRTERIPEMRVLSDLGLDPIKKKFDTLDIYEELIKDRKVSSLCFEESLSVKRDKESVISGCNELMGNDIGVEMMIRDHVMGLDEELVMNKRDLMLISWEP